MELVLAVLVAIFGGVARWWGSSRLTGIDGAADDRVYVFARKAGPAVAAVAVLAAVGLGIARCGGP